MINPEMKEPKHKGRRTFCVEFSIVPVDSDIPKCMGSEGTREE